MPPSFDRHKALAEFDHLIGLLEMVRGSRNLIGNVFNCEGEQVASALQQLPVALASAKASYGAIPESLEVEPAYLIVPYAARPAIRVKQ